MKLSLQVLAGMMLSLAVTANAADVAAGKDKAGMCAACHGIDGNSTVALWPRLAGQHAAYLERHLKLIQSGARSVPEMAGIAAVLTEQDMADLAAYYAAQQPAPAVADAALVAAGELLYRAGNPDTRIPACMACHGPAGEGNPLAGYPALAGQHAAYTARMLNRYKDGERWGTEDAASGVMVGVARYLSDAEIEAVASYIQGLYSQAE